MPRGDWEEFENPVGGKTSKKAKNAEKNTGKKTDVSDKFSTSQKRRDEMEFGNHITKDEDDDAFGDIYGELGNIWE